MHVKAPLLLPPLLLLLLLVLEPLGGQVMMLGALQPRPCNPARPSTTAHLPVALLTALANAAHVATITGWLAGRPAGAQLASRRLPNQHPCPSSPRTAAQVQHVIVCGHYSCGAVKAALRLPCETPGLVNCWISGIRKCRNHHADEL
jgi:hypothetical protein